MRMGSVFGLLLLGGCASAWAQPPTLEHLYPAGGQRGQTVEVTATGGFERWPVQVWTERAGLTITPRDESGTLTITIADDARPGVHWLRLYDEQGATDLRPFLVGTLPEVLEEEPNDDYQHAQAIDRPAVTINGRLERAGDVDSFAVTLREGQTLVAALEANWRLGSPMDGVLQVVSDDGFVLAQNDDEQGLDPRIVFEAPEDGRYVVRAFAFPETPTSTIGFAGNPSFIYRLTLTTEGFLDHVVPLAVTRGVPGLVEAVGSNVPDAARWLAVEPADDTAPFAPAAHPELAETVEVLLEPHATLNEHEPNGPENPQPLPVPGTVTGRIDPPGDADAYQFPALKDQTLILQVESRGLGYPLDPVLRVTDAEGNTLAREDDTDNQRDPRLEFTAPADGSYRVIVTDLNQQGGHRFVYRLRVTEARPQFALTLAHDRFTLTPGEPLEVPVTVERRHGFDRAIIVEAEGLPAIATAEPVLSSPKDEDSAEAVTLTLETTASAPWSGPIQVVGHVSGRDNRPAIAGAPIPGFDGLTTDQPWLTIAIPEPESDEDDDGDGDGDDDSE